jgi:hypothetical protein
MRMTAPAISAAAMALAVALVWHSRPDTEPPLPLDATTVPVQQVLPVNARIADSSTQRANPPSAAAEPMLRIVASTEARAARSPLPGEAASTPMTDLQGRLNAESRPGVAESEREFAAEPVDATRAPGAEADLLARFAQMPGLKLIDMRVHCRSTMCRLELVQPDGAPAVAGGPRPFNILLDSVGLEPRWMISLARRGEPMRSVAYLWREGFAPPKPEPGQPHATD